MSHVIEKVKQYKTEAVAGLVGGSTALVFAPTSALAAAGDPPTVSYDGIKGDIFDQITAALPTVLGVMGTVIAITFGINFLRRQVKKS